MATFALDTSTPSPSLALVMPDGAVARLHLGASPNAGRRVMLAAHGLFTAAGVDVTDISRVVVGVGPGAFTGVRIGISTALGLGQALGCPVEGAVSSDALAISIADSAPEAQVVVPAVDARRGEVFCAMYAVQDGVRKTLLPPCALSPADLAAIIAERADGSDVVIGGTGAVLMTDHVTDLTTILPPTSPGHHIDAYALVRLVEGGAGVAARPVYARLPDAEVNRLRAAEAG